jgi:hypothetical protein
MKNEINKQNLVDFVDPNAVLVRYPVDMFMQRSYTFVPGSEAYGEVHFYHSLVYHSVTLSFQFAPEMEKNQE